MFGQAEAKAVSPAILQTLKEEGRQLPLARLTSLEPDVPNVKTIWVL